MLKKKILKNIDTICDVAGIANDPSSDLNKNYSTKINYSADISLQCLLKNQVLKDIFLIPLVQFMVLIKKRFTKNPR